MTKFKLMHLSFACTFILMASIIMLPLFAYASQYHGEDQDTDDKGGYRLGKKNHKNRMNQLNIQDIKDVISQFDQNGFVFKPKDHELIKGMNNELITTGKARLACLDGLIPDDKKEWLQNALFKNDNRMTKDDQNVVLCHLLGEIQIYINVELKNKDILTCNLIHEVYPCFYDDLLSRLQSTIEEKQFVSFEKTLDKKSELKLEETTSYIVISARNFSGRTHRLEQILIKNDQHTLFVKMDESVVDGLGDLDIHDNHYPQNLKYILFSDTNHVVSTVRDFFFNNAGWVSSITMAGFTDLTQIRNCFLKDNLLTSFSCEGLENVTSIGNCFLGNNQLTSFSSIGLENLFSIGNHFLTHNKHLKSVDLTALKNVAFVGKYFLFKCPNIEKILVTKDKARLFTICVPDELRYKIIVINEK